MQGNQGLEIIDVKALIKAQRLEIYPAFWAINAHPATGLLYIVNNFLSGHVRLRGRGGGRYPFKYLEMIDAVFGKAKHTLEVCSGEMLSDINTTTLDNNSRTADIACQAENLDLVPINSFDRWRADPPYNEKTARQMYNCEMPSLSKLLTAGARVVKARSLLFLLCAQNYQICPPSLKRIGLITITVVPNNELRACNIYLKR